MALKKSSTNLPFAGIEKILRKTGAERISDEAKKEMVEILEEFGLELGKKALELSKHAGRKTIKQKDIILAFKQFK